MPFLTAKYAKLTQSTQSQSIDINLDSYQDGTLRTLRETSASFAVKKAF